MNRYFTTLVNQPEFLAVVGEVKLAEKAAVYDPTNVPKPAAAAAAAAPAAKKEEKKKEEKPAAPKEEKKEAAHGGDEEEESFEDEKKGPNPLDALPPSKFNLEAWKRTVSNLDEKDAIKYFWENIDLEGFSIWLTDYKYNNENKKVFMTSNLLGGFFQRLESARKYAFGSFGVFGEDDDNEVHGVFVFRGQDVPFEVKDCPDYESYEFTKVTDFSEAAKQNINAFFAWSEIDGVAKFAKVTKKFNTGKNFK